MVDYKKAALTGAIAGTVASFIFGRKTRGIDYGKIAKYAAGGAGVVMAAGYVMAETGKPIGLLATRTGHAEGHWDSFPSHIHPEDRPMHPIGHEHFHRY
jgi:hypothetical protein